MPAVPMHPSIKALRAQYRKEDTAFWNQQLDSAIIHKGNCLKDVKKDERPVAAFDMHCVSPRICLSVVRNGCLVCA